MACGRVRLLDVSKLVDVMLKGIGIVAVDVDCVTRLVGVT